MQENKIRAWDCNAFLDQGNAIIGDSLIKII